MIEVSEGYARNFLLPRKLAVLATADAVNTSGDMAYRVGGCQGGSR